MAELKEEERAAVIAAFSKLIEETSAEEFALGLMVMGAVSAHKQGIPFEKLEARIKEAILLSTMFVDGGEA